MSKTRLGILISGRGSNMAAIAKAIQSGLIEGAEIAVVISNCKNAAGLEKAAEFGIDTAVIERQSRSREDHDREMLGVLNSRNVDLVCLAGYMRLLSNSFIEEYRNRILNIHPSLLPAFPGLDVQRQAIEFGVKYSGCTVHFVDETLDGGPIVDQRIVPVHDDDTTETLAARILEQEHELYPRSVARIVRGDYQIVGRRVLHKSAALRGS